MQSLSWAILKWEKERKNSRSRISDILYVVKQKKKTQKEESISEQKFFSLTPNLGRLTATNYTHSA
jgi:hypothetical protein